MRNRFIALTTLIAISGVARAAMVTIGNAGNAADTTGYGAVGYTYQISKYEVTGAEFATAVAADSRVGSSTSVGTKPVSNVSWYEAAKYCNWLTSGDAYAGAYQFNGGGTLTGVDRAAAVTTYGMVYVLPTEDEWYKAAYFKPDASGYSLYANGTSTAPVSLTDANYYSLGTTWAVGSGTQEQNGTYDMMGNVTEWTESAGDGTLDNMAENRAARGGTYNLPASSLSSAFRVSGPVTYEGKDVGFRMAAIPEPASAMMVVFGAGVGLAVHRLRRVAMRR